MANVKPIRLPKTKFGIAANTNMALSYDPFQAKLVVISADAAVTPPATTQGNNLWPKMTAQNLSSFWGPTI